jgi:hypothetical protein
MARITKIVLAVLALAAFGWALTNLKPVPQWILIAIPLLGLLLDTWSAPRIRPRAFLLVTSVAALFGLLFAGSTVVTMANEQLFPNERQVMPFASLIAGAALGLGVFALCVFWLLRPSAAIDRTRRTALVLLLGTALVAVALDRMFE